MGEIFFCLYLGKTGHCVLHIAQLRTGIHEEVGKTGKKKKTDNCGMAEQSGECHPLTRAAKSMYGPW
jgi:hypothetical protein